MPHSLPNPGSCSKSYWHFYHRGNWDPETWFMIKPRVWRQSMLLTKAFSITSLHFSEHGVQTEKVLAMSSSNWALVQKNEWFSHTLTSLTMSQEMLWPRYTNEDMHTYAFTFSLYIPNTDSHRYKYVEVHTYARSGTKLAWVKKLKKDRISQEREREREHPYSIRYCSACSPYLITVHKTQIHMPVTHSLNTHTYRQCTHPHIHIIT